jgi:GntR family carbon starvation induced transcriptional regulator
MTAAQTRAQSIGTLLEADILTGRVAPGDWLRLPALAEAYGVSLSPLREALARLVGSGLVLQESQRGFRVAPISAEDLADLVRLRVRIETEALLASMAAADASWEGALLAAQHRLFRHPRAAERLLDEAWEVAHRDFHFALIAGCGSPRTLAFCGTLYDHFDRYRRLGVLSAGRHPRLTGSHQAIVAAALAGEAEQAAALLRAHIEEAAAEVQAMLERTGFAVPGTRIAAPAS